MPQPDDALVHESGYSAVKCGETMGQNKQQELSRRAILREPLLYLLDGLVEKGPTQQQSGRGASGWQHHHRRHRHFSSGRMNLQMSAH